jgi:hypothetical protein
MRHGFQRCHHEDSYAKKSSARKNKGGKIYQTELRAGEVSKGFIDDKESMAAAMWVKINNK